MEQTPTPEARKEVDRHGEEITKALDSYGQIYKKQGEVQARQATKEEEVVTIMKSSTGEVETKNKAMPGDWIVTNPGGEEYVLKPEKFAARYEPKEGADGVFAAKGYCVAVKNPFESAITMKASWGEMQNGAADCMIADTYEYQTGKRGGEPYIIAKKEFDQTYKVD